MVRINFIKLSLRYWLESWRILMKINTQKDGSKIIVRSQAFSKGMDLSNTLFERLETYFLEQGFKITEKDERRLVVSKGSLFRNFIAFKMKDLRRDITIEEDDHDMLRIISNVDTRGQTIRKSEMDVFSLEVNDIINFIQNKQDSQLSIKQDKKARSENYLLLIVIFSITFALAVIILTIKNW